MRKALIKPYGYIGDILFAAGAAKALKDEGQFDVVEFANGFRQVEPLLKLNPYLDVVYTTPQPTDRPWHNVAVTGYDAVFQLTETTKLEPPPQQFQRECGVRTPTPEYHVYTDPVMDEKVAEQLPDPYVAVMEVGSWRPKAFAFTAAEYDRAVDVPYKGYGGRMRDVRWILDQLSKDFRLVTVGVTATSLQSAYSGQERSLVYDASVLKQATAFLGAEGGLANVAAGVGCKTFLTSEFVWQLYGPKGVLRRIPEPKLGPRYYFPDAGHVDLNPYATDAEVLTTYQRLLTGAVPPVDTTYDWITHGQV